VLRAVDPDIHNTEVVDDGFVEFEFVGRTQYLRERSCTSVDAFMIGRTAVGHRRAFLIEWKYTESYRQEDKYIPDRSKVYDDLVILNASSQHYRRARDAPIRPR
jgi:hypothetical protein